MMNFNRAENVLHRLTLLLLAVPCLVMGSGTGIADFKFQPPIIIPATDKQLGTVIFLHGHGQRTILWEPELEKIHEPYLKIIIPTPNQWPIEYHNNLSTHSWYDFYGDQIPTLRDDAKGMNTSKAYVHHLIEEEIKNGVPPEHIIVAGYSQGAPLALHAGLSFPKKLGGIAAFSSFKPLNKTFTETINKVNKDIPILNCFLERAPYANDEICINIEDSLKTVTKNGIYKNYTYSQGQHYIVDREWEDMRDFCDGIIKKS